MGRKIKLKKYHEMYSTFSPSYELKRKRKKRNDCTFETDLKFYMKYNNYFRFYKYGRYLPKRKFIYDEQALHKYTKLHL